MVTRTSARLSASQARIGSYASKIGFQIGSLSRRRSLANPIVGVCDVAIAPMILAMIAFLLPQCCVLALCDCNYSAATAVDCGAGRHANQGDQVSVQTPDAER